jgi:hypothetical protein
MKTTSVCAETMKDAATRVCELADAFGGAAAGANGLPAVFAAFERFDAIRPRLPEPTRTDADLTRHAAVELMKARDYLAAATQLGWLQKRLTTAAEEWAKDTARRTTLSAANC